MSDFLVNLARRSAGLAPVVRARVAPAVPVDLDSSADLDPERQVVSRGGAEGAEVVARSVAPGPQAGGVTNVAPVIVPAPVVQAASHVAAPVVQRVPVASAAPAPVSTPASVRAADAPSVVLRVGARSAEPAPIIVPASTAVAPALRAERDAAPRARESREESPTIETRTEAIVRPEAAAAVPVVVMIEPVERAATAATVQRTEPAPERTVHVRIGAIEIHGADAAAQQHSVTATAAAPAPAALPTPSPGGFDEYAALRSYAPWAW